ncbi:cyclopropane-fatty-acyl-phospholipid synthase family protein [Bradyrhizobium sp. JYMT SZCCT0428]|uniref:SAM-dependent methyltransferase n=1 Tax=Bradyrhizobium sp. JYMT SZCCT0428 TaxID=2807673 RepID=UPI001BA49325|nr:cyclopropane-fatty-acyl-phospholipid synthase family protein [Bradyrhizobium sp. JYMT SZCCT0428]MBR1154050.1 class I SAM-dependent methyltransferase [Bradyrhizobium sp. JYMT SZCCT0428]MBR1230290.1 class I SAM-dependent methyltransferase [Bradyrhizobium sp. AUGA SZCCT0176]MBR1302314.1 class I SAM-dependent methyltransferase [Bradyrhizobium sp. AUGA SZCCT0042]
MSLESQHTAAASVDAATTPTTRTSLNSFMQRMLRKIDCGEILVHTPAGRRFLIGGKRTGEQTHLTIHSWKCVLRLLTSGDLGFAEGYLAGEWSTPNLHSFLSAVARRSTDAASFEGLRPPQPVTKFRHALNRNTRRGSRRNIAAHYDLGNDFYRLWLDPSMTYSSAIYSSPAETLDQAQRNKLDRVTELLELNGGERVLEIGCGWGGLAGHMIQCADCHVTGLTLSNEQLSYARQQLAERGYAGKSDLKLQDYRDESRTYDRVVSVEMLEAVGEAYWPTFFANLRERLNPQGVAVLQVITIDQCRFESYRRRPDFIQRYIFPGGMLPTKEIIGQLVAKSGLRLTSSEFFGESYALTLADWHRRFLEAWPFIKALGFDDRFKRMWEYYLAYCRLGFEIGILNVGLYKIEPQPTTQRGASA